MPAVRCDVDGTLVDTAFLHKVAVHPDPSALLVDLAASPLARLG